MVNIQENGSQRKGVEREMLSALDSGSPVSKIDFALNAADRGFVPFPLGENSDEPAFPEGDAMATKNKTLLRHWWDENPKYNVGFSLENLLTLRINSARCPANTFEPLAALLLEHGVPSSVKTVRKLSDAPDVVEICLHFLLPDGATVEARSDVLFDGIDVLSSDDFVVGPGSVIDGNGCEFMGDNALSPATPWLLEACGVQLADHEEEIALAAIKTVAPSIVMEKIAAPEEIAEPKAVAPIAVPLAEAAPPSIVAKEAAAPKATTPKPATNAAPPAAASKEAAACDAARRGFDVFPIRWYIHPGEGATEAQLEAAVKAAKVPLIKHWQTLASQDPQQFKTWWAQWRDANLAMTTDRFIVVDIDPRNGGTDTFEMLQMVHDFPDTLTSIARRAAASIGFLCCRRACA